MPGPANAAGCVVAQTSLISTSLNKKYLFPLRILAAWDPGTCRRAGAVIQMQGESLWFDLQIKSNLKILVHFCQVNQSRGTSINFWPNPTEPLWSFQWALAIEDVAFYSCVNGNIKHHDDTSYRIVTMIILCDVSWRERRKNAAGCRKCKNLYFKMSSSVISFCRPNHIHVKRCCASKHPRAGVIYPTSSGRGLIIHDLLRAARAGNAK